VSCVVAGVLGATRQRAGRRQRGATVRLAAPAEEGKVEKADKLEGDGVNDLLMDKPDAKKANQFTALPRRFTEDAAAPEADGVTKSSVSSVAPSESREKLLEATESSALPEGQKEAVSNFFFPDSEDLDMDKSMPLDDHIREFREGALRTLVATVLSVGVCLTFYKELTVFIEAPAMMNGAIVKFVQLGPGEFFFVSVKAAIAVGLLIAFPYALFEAALYFTPALTKAERDVVGPTVLASAVLFYAGIAFSQLALAPAALGFFISYSQDVIESQFSIDQYFEFILSLCFSTGLAFQVPILQVSLGLLGILSSEKLLGAWRYVIVGSAVVGAILTPSTDPITQLLLSGALCALYFGGAGVLYVFGK